MLIVVPAGETAKSLKTVQDCCDHLAEQRLERKSFIVALGGGVVGDLASFVAASYLRGIPFVQAPTTLLALVDSSVGGKVGVDLKAGKNLVGAFYQPKLVLCDLDTLQLCRSASSAQASPRSSNTASSAMPGCLRNWSAILPKILKRDPKTLAAVIARCCEIKADVVRARTKPRGVLRAILNFGHTIGHAIENSSGYGKLLHGEAISIGQVAAAKLSGAILGLPKCDVERVGNIFRRAGLPVAIKLNTNQRQQIVCRHAAWTKR